MKHYQQPIGGDQCLLYTMSMLVEKEPAILHTMWERAFGLTYDYVHRRSALTVWWDCTREFADILGIAHIIPHRGTVWCGGMPLLDPLDTGHLLVKWMGRGHGHSMAYHRGIIFDSNITGPTSIEAWWMFEGRNVAKWASISL